MPIFNINIPYNNESINSLKTILVQGKHIPVQSTVDDNNREENINLFFKLLQYIETSREYVLSLFPELAFSTNDINTIIKSVNKFKGNLFFSCGFGFSQGEKLKKLITTNKINCFLKKYEVIIDDLKYNCGLILIKTNKIYEKYLFIKNFADQNIEISYVYDQYLSNTILRVNCFNLTIFPLICADLICSTKNCPTDLIYDSLVLQPTNNHVIIPLLLYTKKPHHELWKKSFIKFYNTIHQPFYFIMANEEIQNINLKMNLTGIISNLAFDHSKKIYNGLHGIIADTTESGLFYVDLKLKSTIVNIQNNIYSTNYPQRKNNDTLKLSNKVNISTDIGNFIIKIEIPQILQHKNELWGTFINQPFIKLTETINNNKTSGALEILKKIFDKKKYLNFFSIYHTNIILLPELSLTIKDIIKFENIFNKHNLPFFFFAGMKLINKEDLKLLIEKYHFEYLHSTNLKDLKISYLINPQIFIIRNKNVYKKIIFLKNSIYRDFNYLKSIFFKQQILRIDTLDTSIYSIIGDDLEKIEIQKQILEDLKNNNLDRILLLNLCSNLSFDTSKKADSIKLFTEDPRVLLYIISDSYSQIKPDINIYTNGAFININNIDRIFMKELHHVRYFIKDNYIAFRNRLNLPGVSSGILRWKQSADRGRGTYMPIRRYILSNNKLKKVHGNKDAQELYSYLIFKKQKILENIPKYFKSEILFEYKYLLDIFDAKLFKNKYKDAAIWPKLITGVEKSKEPLIRSDEVNKYENLLDITIPALLIIKIIFKAEYSLNSNLYGQLYIPEKNLDILVWNSPFYTTYYIINILQQIAILSGSMMPLIVIASGFDKTLKVKDCRVIPNKLTDFTICYQKDITESKLFYLSKYRFIYFINLENFIQLLYNTTNFSEIKNYLFQILNR